MESVFLRNVAMATTTTAVGSVDFLVKFGCLASRDLPSLIFFPMGAPQ